MVLDSLGSGLRNTLDKIRNAVFVDDSLIKEVAKDVQRSLIKADVNIELVLEIASEIKQKAKADTPPGLTKKEHLIKVLYDELVQYLGEETPDIHSRVKTSEEPYKIMLVGLFGSGKTTTTGKLAKHFKKQGLKVCATSTDTWRPAAAEQLRQLGEQISVPVLQSEADSPTKRWKDIEEQADEYDVVLIDTAGRDSLNEELQEEILEIRDSVEADETLLVISGDIGQGAKDVAEMFAENLGVSGIIVTKLDGTAKGGGALTACHAANAPIYFIGVGERVDDLERFEPERFVGRLLGMGDLKGLLEKSQEAFSEEEAEDLTKKMMSGDFDLRDLYSQLEGMQKMGPLKKVMDMIPGFNKMNVSDSDLEQQQERMKRWKYFMDSMTEEELSNPDVIRRHRVWRISEGAGQDPKELRALLKQYRQTKKMMKKFGGKGNKRDLQKMMKQMGGSGGLNF